MIPCKKSKECEVAKGALEAAKVCCATQYGLAAPKKSGALPDMAMHRTIG